MPKPEAPTSHNIHPGHEATATDRPAPDGGQLRQDNRTKHRHGTASRSEQVSQVGVSRHNSEHRGVFQSVFGSSTKAPASTAPPSSSGPPHPGSATPHPPPTYEAEYEWVGSTVRHWNREDFVEVIVKKRREYRDAVEKIETLKQELVTSYREQSDLHERLSRQDQDVRQAQESAFAMMASSASKAEDDEVISSKFKAIRTQWKKFAKEWAVRDLPEITEENRMALSQLFGAHVASGEGHTADGIWAMKNRSKAPAILLNAELGRFIGQEIIQRPFITAFNFGVDLGDDLDSSSSTMKTLEMLYNVHRKENPVSAHLWRSQTVQLLNNQESNPPSSEPSIQEERRKRYYAKLASNFIASKAAFLLRPGDDEEFLEQLFAIFRSTGELVSKLWGQKVLISVLGHRELVRQPFNINSEEFEAHATHKLEAGDESMDGVPIQIVVEPAIVAWGNERGESYGTKKVWSKAVVWLSSSSGEASEAGQAAVSETGHAGPQEA